MEDWINTAHWLLLPFGPRAKGYQCDICARQAGQGW
jgi:hypothetical protein